MTIRPYRPSDFPELVGMHRRQCLHDGLGYLLPNPEDPLQFATLVAEEEGELVGMASGRRIIEGQTVIDPAYGGIGTSGPVVRWMLLSQLARALARVSYDAGYRELLAATAPTWRGYGNRLVKELGFTRDLRARFYLDLNLKFGGADGHA